jgi:hypothetical protein
MQGASTWLSLYDAIKSYEKLGVDDYQRTYSWTEEQIDEFFEDLCHCIENPKKNHFFGTLILQSDEEKRQATIVDGQQRLTTAFLFVFTLRDCLTKLDNKILLRGRPISVEQKVLDFLCSSEESEDDFRFESSRFLERWMKECVHPVPDEQARIPKREQGNSQHFMDTLPFRKAVQYIRKIVNDDLEGTAGDFKLERINKFIDCLRDRFSVLCIKTQSIDVSLELFLTLNNRGLPLGPSDLVRGDIMRVLGDGKSDEDQKEIQREILEDWHDFSKTIVDTEAFMRHYLLSITEKAVQKKKVHELVMKRVHGDLPKGSSDTDTLRVNAQAFWDDLVAASSEYGKILSPTMGGETQHYISLMEGLLKSHRVVMLTILRTVQDIDEREELTRLVCSLAFRWVMANKNAQKLENKFQEFSTELRTGTDIETVIDNIKEEIDKIPFVAKEYFEENPESFASRAALYSVARRCAGTALSIEVGDKKLSLEYIAPKSPTTVWQDSVMSGAGKDEDYVSIVSSIGNLTLLEKTMQKKDRNKSFTDKSNVFKASSFEVSSDIANFSDWSHELIKQREEWICMAFDLLFGPEKFEGSIEPFSEWYMSH